MVRALWLASLILRDASAASEAIVGDLRVQALTPRLLRVEPRGPKGFENRTTLTVASRDFQGLEVSTEASDQGTRVKTEHYTVLLRGSKSPPGGCSDPRSGVDVTGAVRSKKFPDGARAGSASACCDACGSDPSCVAWVFVDSGGCYPLGDYTSSVSSPGHTFGGPGSSCSATEASDAENPVRSAKFPDGAPASGAGECCDQCKTDPTCVAYVFVASFGGCYPLSSYSATKASSGHAFARVTRAGGPNFQVTSPSGEVLYDSQEDGKSNLLHWPSPLQAKSYGLLDKPRFFVPEWGAAPIPDGAQVEEDLRISNGYDFGNQVDGDTYVFLLGADLDAFAAARKDFLALTGPVPELPDFAFGTWFTFWHPYSEDEAKEDVQRWETLQLPLDVWGLDINWRGVNCDGPGCTGPVDTPHQCDYDHPDTDKFPDFDGWFAWLSEHKLRTYHNDHPCAQGPQAGPEETAYRYAGLGKWLGKGMTFWWFDLNWQWSIPPPFRGNPGEDWDGLDTSVWGSHVFYTSTAYFNEHVRKPQGTDYGSATIALSKSFKPDWEAGMPAIHGAEHPAHHRYPVHWTGDYVSLRASVESMVDSGVHSFKPFVHSDCGGDYGQSQGDVDDVTSAAGLLRWTGHCAYGSILRFHGADHRVWQYNEATQQAFKSFLDARYRLLPSIKAAAKRASEEGHPLVARLDLFHAEHPEAADNSQYLFLDDILVAPIFAGNEDSRQVWVPPGDWQDAWDPSKVLTGPTTVTVQQPSERIPMWHRRDGGLLVLAPESTRVDAQDWSLLSLEAFPSNKAWNSSRRLHEAAGSTEIEMRTDGHGRVSIHIGEAPSSRAWAVRVHLRPQQRLCLAAVDGVAIASLAALHLEADNVRYFPLLGAGTGLPPGAGAVAELRLEPAARARTVEVTIREPAMLV